MAGSGERRGELEACLRATDEVLREARIAGIDIRVLGSIGVWLHCPRYRQRLVAMDREEPPDLDLIVRSDDRQAARSLFERLGYVEDRDVLVAMEGRRYAYDRGGSGLHLDVFVDVLDFCHAIDLRGRFEADAPTIPLVELVLEKLQIVEINERDLKDLAVLFLEHEVASGPPDAIDADRIARLLARDWGFYYTVTRNAERLASFVDGQPVLSDEERATVRRRIDALVGRVEAEPKGARWRLRARVGPRVQWYRDVSEMEATF